jgi:hypothetical protein
MHPPGDARRELFARPAGGARPRAAVDPDGGDITVYDAVLVARRRA